MFENAYRIAIVGTGGIATAHAQAIAAMAGRARLVAVVDVHPGRAKEFADTCHTLWYRDDAYFAVPWRGSFEIEGGGPTMGHGIHQFDLLLSILGPWEQVTAVAGRQARPTQTEDVSLALVTFANGAVASIVNSLVSARETSTLRFDYENATVELEHLYGYQDSDWTVTPAPGHDGILDAWSTGGIDVPSGHTAQLTAVLDAMDNGQLAPVSLPDARNTMELVAAIYASAFTGAPVRRGDLDPSNPFTARMGGTGAPWAAGW